MIDRDLTVDLVVTPAGSAGRVTSHGVTWDEIGLGDREWFRGAPLWQATVGKPRAGALGDGWVLVTDPSAAFGFAGPLHNLPDRVPGVVFSPHPRLVNKGGRDLHGQHVVELASSTDIYDVLAEGTPYPVRWLETENPGPDGKPCGIVLDHFGAPAKVRAPASYARL